MGARLKLAVGPVSAIRTFWTCGLGVADQRAVFDPVEHSFCSVWAHILAVDAFAQNGHFRIALSRKLLSAGAITRAPSGQVGKGLLHTLFVIPRLGANACQHAVGGFRVVRVSSLEGVAQLELSLTVDLQCVGAERLSWFGLGRRLDGGWTTRLTGPIDEG